MNVSDKSLKAISRLFFIRLPEPDTKVYGPEEIAQSIVEALESARNGEYKDFRKNFDGLSNAEIQEIIAVMLVGRGDFESYDDALRYGMDLHGDESDRDMAIDYIRCKKLRLKQYLWDGLQKMNVREMNVELISKEGTVGYECNNRL